MTLNTYSQDFEDQLSNRILNNPDNGFFIDIGAHDGIYINNTLYFSKKNWKGVCVEAHPDYAEICKKKRSNKNTIVLSCACGESDDDNITLYSNYRGSLSTTNPDTKLHNFYKNSGYGPWYKGQNYNKKVNNMTNGPILISSLTLDTIIDKYLSKLNFNSNCSIDILSIDVDGSEKYVLKGFSIQKYKPKIIIIEHTTPNNSDYILNYLKSNNYKLLFKTPSNFIAIDNNINNINEEHITFNTNGKINIPIKSIILKSIFEDVKNNSVICKEKHPLDK